MTTAAFAMSEPPAAAGRATPNPAGLADRSGPAADRSGPRRLPTPAWEPPYDDELTTPLPRRHAGPAGPATQGTLALEFVLPSGLPAEPEPALPRTAPDGGAATGAPPRLRLVGEAERTATVLPEPRAWTARLVQAVVEVLAGDRPVSQLAHWTDAEVFADLHRRVTVTARRCPPGRSGQQRAAVRSVRVSSPAPGVAEACALVQRGPRTTALALRLEAGVGRWRCTALELG